MTSEPTPAAAARLVGSPQRRSSISFEFFPPKDEAGTQGLWQAIRQLEVLHPNFVSVTYGAGGTTREATTAITAQIAAQTTLTPVAHLTCVGSSVAELRSIIAQYAAGGVHAIMALRGDPPGGLGVPWQLHPEGLDHATDLVRLIREVSDFRIGVAAFPQVHPESPNLAHDVDVLCRKADAGADFAVTQFFFESHLYFRLVDELAAAGCDLPIIPGIMPITNVAQIERFAALSGAPLPTRITEAIHAVADDPDAVRALGIDIATDLSAALLAGGAPGLHFYTLNRSTASLQVYHNLQSQLV